MNCTMSRATVHQGQDVYIRGLSKLGVKFEQTIALYRDVIHASLLLFLAQVKLFSFFFFSTHVGVVLVQYDRPTLQ